jgi:hypothetical protein
VVGIFFAHRDGVYKFPNEIELIRREKRKMSKKSDVGVRWAKSWQGVYLHPGREIVEISFPVRPCFN